MEEYTIKLVIDGIEWRADVTGTAKEVYRLSSSMARRCLKKGCGLMVAYFREFPFKFALFLLQSTLCFLYDLYIGGFV